ncbi:hypothetical protein ACJVC5_09095 [Peredibacter sp. HCB2-198]|uniref:hypothetical protein n=1 Tax=Peredibacter sp. HCB2-198 TaxID=3383025 RepID=UPI0038B5F703
MRSWSLALSLMLFSAHLFAQEQMALRLNENGMMKILRMAIQYNTSSKTSRTVVIPQNIYKFTIKKEQLTSNPIIPVINEISDLNLNRDLDFYLNTSDIKVTGNVDEKSLKMSISNSNDNGFDLKLSLNLPQIVVNGARLSLCEDKAKNGKSCGSGLQASMTNLKIQTKNRPVSLSATLRLRTDGKVARVTVLSVTSNLEGKNAPAMDINFQAVTVPKIAIVIDGQETELDTSRLKDEILKRKAFLAAKLMSFAADFITSDLAEMINVYLVNKQVATSYQVYRKEGLKTFNEFMSDRDSYPNRENYVRSAIQPEGKDPMTVIMAEISEVIRNAQVDIALKKISTPQNKDIELAGFLNFVLNNRAMTIKNTLGNSNRALPKLDLTAHRNHDINLAISEPLINGALDLVNTTGLYQEVFNAMADVKGFSIKSIKMHFQGDKSVVAVVNAQVDLKKLQSSGFSSWIKNKLAAYLERNNNNAVIYFPIEVQVVPTVKNLPTGGVGLDLKVLSPFNYVELPNKFNYPSNVGNMTDIVKDGVMEQLKDNLEPYVNKTYSVDVTKFLNQSGVVFLPKAISINQGAYFLLNLDLVDIKFNSKNPNLR